MASMREQHGEVDRAAIARLAYQLWEQEGHRHGDDLRHWLEAETRWRQEQVMAAPGIPVKAPPRPRRSVGLRGTRHH